MPKEFAVSHRRKLDEKQLDALERRIRIAEDSGRETVTISPTTLRALIDDARALTRLLEAARREVTANNCWCSNWRGPGKTCSWCQLKAAMH